MKTIIEITPTSKTKYTMPEDAALALGFALDIGLIGSIKEGVQLLIAGPKIAVEIEELPMPLERLSGWTGDIIFDGP